MPIDFAGDVPTLFIDVHEFQAAFDRLPNQGVGALVQILGHLWVYGQLPNDDVALARIGGIRPRLFARIRVVLETCFDVGADGRWRRVDLEEQRAIAFDGWSSER